MLSIQRLDQQECKLLIKGARIRAAQIGVPMCIAITDESGNLLAFERMDGSKVTSITIAQDKSFTASLFFAKAWQYHFERSAFF